MSDMKRSYRDTVIVDAEFKMIVIGNPDVGKSSIIQRMTENKFNSKKSPTYGMDKNDMIITKNDTKIKFAIWDTAGQQNYKHITSNFINGSSGVFLCFDLTSLNSFLALEEWVKIVQEKVDNKTLVYVLGNKCDLPPENWTVNKQQIDRFITMNKITKYFEVTADDPGLRQGRHRRQRRFHPDVRSDHPQQRHQETHRPRQRRRQRPEPALPERNHREEEERWLLLTFARLHLNIISQ